jgi:hypothetical protein
VNASKPSLTVALPTMKAEQIDRNEKNHRWYNQEKSQEKFNERLLL